MTEKRHHPTKRWGFTSYINAYPLHASFQDEEILLDVPSHLNSLLQQNLLETSLVSSYEYILRNYKAVSPLGIGSSDAIMSVNFYIRPEEYSLDKWHCFATDESATSIQLLKVLAIHFWKKEITFSPKGTSFLLIGDQALKKQHLQGYMTLDLARSWKEESGMDFIFALFAGKKSETFIKKLTDSLEFSMKHFDRILDKAQKASSLDRNFLQKYYSLHHYYLEESHFRGLNHFAKLCSKIPKKSKKCLKV